MAGVSRGSRLVGKSHGPAQLPRNRSGDLRGVGIATDAGKKVTDDPYRLGTTFALSFAGGLRFVPGGRFQIRADAGTYMYQIKYPAGYYINATDNTAVLGPTQTKNFWKRNGVYTLGLSYLLFR